MIAARISRNRRENKIHGESNSQREQLQAEIMHGQLRKMVLNDYINGEFASNWCYASDHCRIFGFNSSKEQ